MEKKMRIIRDKIRDEVKRIGKPFNLSVNYVNGSARVTRPMGNGETNVSPRLRNSEMIWWLDGFSEGCKLEAERIKAELKPLRERLEAWRDNAVTMKIAALPSTHQRWSNEYDNYKRLTDILDKL
jgi:hypothetical protein